MNSGMDDFDIINFVLDEDYPGFEQDLMQYPDNVESEGPTLSTCTQQPTTSLSVTETGMQLNTGMLTSDSRQNLNPQEGMGNLDNPGAQQLTQGNMQGYIHMGLHVEGSVQAPMQSGTWNNEQTQQQQEVDVHQQMSLDVSQVDWSEQRKRKKDNMKKVKQYQLTAPFADKGLELRRINAIKAKQYRDKKKQIEHQLKKEGARLHQELGKCNLEKNQLIEEINRLRQENYELKKILT